MNNQIKHFNAFSHKIWMLPSVYVLIPLCVQMRKNDLTILSLSPACRGFNFQSGIRLVSVQPHREKDSEHVNNRGVGEGLWTLQSSIWVLDLHISLEYFFFILIFPQNYAAVVFLLGSTIYTDFFYISY